MSWREEFGGDWAVPRAVEQMVDEKIARDTSSRHDAAPSFSAPLSGKRFIRLWVEHPSFLKRRGGPHRFRLEVTRSLSEEGREWIVSDQLHEVLPYMIAAIQGEGFHLMGVRPV